MQTDLSIYFEPISKLLINDAVWLPETIGNRIQLFNNHTDLSSQKYDIALIGVSETRNSPDQVSGLSAIRNKVYALYDGGHPIKIIDMGNLKIGHKVEDTYYALSYVISELIKKEVVPIIIGGSQNLTYGIYKAYEALEKIVNIVAVDSRLDVGNEKEIYSKGFLKALLSIQPNWLFNYSNIGYQTYLVGESDLSFFRKMFFDAYRLGWAKANIQDVEPIIRNTDILSVDMAVVRQSDAPGVTDSSPNGLYGEEICQMMRYAGMADKLSSMGIFDYNPNLDNNSQTAHLVAQMIWCFIDGFYNRKNDYPFPKSKNHTKYCVSVKNNQYEITFYKSNETDRWWMNVPYPMENIKYERHQLVPCSYGDYLVACNEELPDRWWQAYQKLS